MEGKSEGLGGSQVVTLTLLTLSFMVGEVAHFLPMVTRSLSSHVSFVQGMVWPFGSAEIQSTARYAAFVHFKLFFFFFSIFFKK